MHYTQSNNYFFRTKSKSGIVCFTLMTSLTMTSFSMTRLFFNQLISVEDIDKRIQGALAIRVSVWFQTAVYWSVLALYYFISTIHEFKHFVLIRSSYILVHFNYINYIWIHQYINVFRHRWRDYMYLNLLFLYFVSFQNDYLFQIHAIEILFFL